MKWLTIGCLSIILFSGCGSPPMKTISINNKPLTIEVANTPATYKQGLGDRESMPLDHGMLFVFDHAEPYLFWMRHMRFPLDIVWLNQGIVVDIVTLPAPKEGEEPAAYTPMFAANQVLELNAGQAQVYGLQPGARIIFP